MFHSDEISLNSSEGKSLSVDRLQIEKYKNYREFLADYYQWRRVKNFDFNFSQFSRELGLKSPNYLKLIIDGKRNLSRAMAKKFIEAFGLKGEESKRFLNLVEWNQSKTVAERQILGSKLSFSSKVEEHSDEWLEEVILLVFDTLSGSTLTYDTIEYFFEGRIHKNQIIKVIEVLRKKGKVFGSIEKGFEVNGFQSEEGNLNTSLQDYTRLAIESHYFDDLSSRETGTMTTLLSENDRLKMEKEFSEFIESLSKGDLSTNQPKAIYRLSYQIFPLAKVPS